MKLKFICVLLILACGSLLASPRKYPCPQADTASVRVEKQTQMQRLLKKLICYLCTACQEACYKLFTSTSKNTT